MYISTTAKEIGGVLLTSALLVSGVTVLAQNDQTGADLSVQSGSQTIYAGDRIDNDDICTPASITAGSTVEGVTCSGDENSIALPSLFIRPNRQNPATVVHDIVIEDLRGFQNANYTVTAEVSDFTTGGGASIDLGSNPDGITGADAGEVTSIVVTNGGSGYTQGTVGVTISGGTPTTAATATATVDAGVVTGINVTNPGAGYQTGDVLTATITDSGTGTGATAEVSFIPAGDNLSVGTVDTITVDNGGTGYTDTTVVTIDAPTGSGTQVNATAYPLIDGSGTITDIIILNPGQAYVTAPTVTITDANNTGGGATATATASVTAEGASQDNLFVTLDPSNGDLSRLRPTAGAATNFQAGGRTFITSPTTQHTLFYTTAAVPSGRFEIDNVGFGLRVPAFVSAGTYEATITQTVIN